mgnify:CR=1 FL=1
MSVSGSWPVWFLFAAPQIVPDGGHRHVCARGCLTEYVKSHCVCQKLSCMCRHSIVFVFPEYEVLSYMMPSTWVKSSPRGI